MNNTIHVTIEDMHCGNCENKIRNALIALPFVASASVSSQAGSAEVHTSGDINEGSIRDAITGAEGGVCSNMWHSVSLESPRF